MKKRRGGGTGGDSARFAAQSVGTGSRVKADEGQGMEILESKQNSCFPSTFRASCFFSERLPSSTALHSLQGCLPSKVLRNASVRGASFENFTAIPTQATDCSNAQCNPSERFSVRTTSTLVDRGSTRLGCACIPAVSTACAQTPARGAKQMMAAPNRHTAAPIKSHRSGEWPSTHFSQASDAAM